MSDDNRKVWLTSSDSPRSSDFPRIGNLDPWARFVGEIAHAWGKPIPLSGLNGPMIGIVPSFAEDRYTVTLPYTEHDEYQRPVKLHGLRRQEFFTHDDATNFAIECWARGQLGVSITTPTAAVAYNARRTSV